MCSSYDLLGGQLCAEDQACPQTTETTGRGIKRRRVCQNPMRNAVATRSHSNSACLALSTYRRHTTHTHRTQHGDFRIIEVQQKGKKETIARYNKCQAIMFEETKSAPSFLPACLAALPCNSERNEYCPNPGLFILHDEIKPLLPPTTTRTHTIQKTKVHTTI